MLQGLALPVARIRQKAKHGLPGKLSSANSSRSSSSSRKHANDVHHNAPEATGLSQDLGNLMSEAGSASEPVERDSRSSNAGQ